MNQKMKCPTVEAIQNTWKTMWEHIELVIPFKLVGLANLFCLICIYFSPRYPLSIIFAPPIRRFMGEQYLHYPYNFIAMPKLFQKGELVIVLTLGLLMTAYALSMLRMISAHEKVKPLKGLLGAVRNYLKFLFVFIALYFLIIFIGKFVFFLLEPIFKAYPSITFVAIIIEIAIIIFAQSLVFFTFPSFIIGGRKLFAGIKESFGLLIRNSSLVLALVTLPCTLCVISKGVIFAQGPLTNRFGPEVIFWILVINIIINVIVDIFITLFAGTAYIQLDTNSSKS